MDIVALKNIHKKYIYVYKISKYNICILKPKQLLRDISLFSLLRENSKFIYKDRLSYENACVCKTLFPFVL